ncbi:MAG: PEP-CTERM sorting domain-containing protein, partial [Verrucomicrobia bacterium]|nr:PEP-CTERM sorting domain-containing protein [Verrucomicrobiota bacterium]
FSTDVYTYGESVFFSFNEDVRLVAFDAAYGSVRKYGLRSNELNFYNLSSTSLVIFNSDTILSQGDTLEFFGINGTPAVDVAATGLVVETIPEPSTIVLLTVMSGALVMIRRRFRR